MGVGLGHCQVAQASPAASPLTLPFPVLPLESAYLKSKKGNSEGFLEPAPEACLSWGGHGEGGGGPEKRQRERRKGRQDKGPRAPLKLSLTPAREGVGVGLLSPAGGNGPEFLKNVSNSCGNRDCKNSPPLSTSFSALPQPPKSQSSTPRAPTLCPPGNYRGGAPSNPIELRLLCAVVPDHPSLLSPAETTYTFPQSHGIKTLCDCGGEEKAT